MARVLCPLGPVKLGAQVVLVVVDAADGHTELPAYGAHAPRRRRIRRRAAPASSPQHAETPREDSPVAPLRSRRTRRVGQKPAAHDAVAVVQHRGLSRRNPALRRSETQANPPFPEGLRPRPRPQGADTEAAPSPRPGDAARANETPPPSRRRCSLRRRLRRDGPALGHDAQRVPRRTRGADAPTLTDRKPVNALVRSEHSALDRLDGPDHRRARQVSGHEVCVVAALDEAEVGRVGLGGHREPSRGGHRGPRPWSSRPAATPGRAGPPGARPRGSTTDPCGHRRPPAATPRRRPRRCARSAPSRRARRQACARSP